MEIVGYNFDMGKSVTVYENGNFRVERTKAGFYDIFETRVTASHRVSGLTSTIYPDAVAFDQVKKICDRWANGELPRKI